ncbi:MAG TPA: GFA family protein [Devosia sp.]|jgi:hypothetical protein|nr:GFA family protein [Devosia sp.]
MPVKTHTGGCHCGSIRYEVELDLAKGTAACNCSFCRRARSWVASGEPGALRVTSGDDKLGRYSATSPKHEHCFCTVCGIRVFSRGEIEGMGPFLTVQVASLDDSSFEEAKGMPVTFQDGLHDNWWNTPADIRRL